MTKQEEFLWIVQTVILANGINLTAIIDEKELAETRHKFSATGVRGRMADAVLASKRIPDDMTAIEAADEFCSFMIETDEKDKQRTVPAWFANLGM